MGALNQGGKGAGEGKGRGGKQLIERENMVMRKKVSNFGGRKVGEVAEGRGSGIPSYCNRSRLTLSFCFCFLFKRKSFTF